MDNGKPWFVVAASPKASLQNRYLTSARYTSEPRFPVKPVLSRSIIDNYHQREVKPYLQWFFYYFVLGEYMAKMFGILKVRGSIVMAACGLVYQLNDIANLYFRYETVTVFEIESKLRSFLS